MNFLSMTSAQFYTRDGLGSSHMVIAKVPAVVAAVLFMSSVSAQAMEFANRPGVMSEVLASSSAILAMPIEDRGQVNHRVVRPATVPGIRPASRHRPVSKSIPTRMAAMMFVHSLGPISHGVSAFSSSGIKFENRPGPVNRFKELAAGKNKLEGHPDFTSSLSRATTSSDIHTGSAEFCAGSIAPCDLARLYSAAVVASMSAVLGKISELPSSPF
jgi:hypothetical protein